MAREKIHQQQERNLVEWASGLYVEPLKQEETRYQAESQTDTSLMEALLLSCGEALLTRNRTSEVRR